MHVCADVLCCINDFYFDFFICNNGIDAGHQMKKKIGCALYVFNHYWWRIFVGSQAWEWKNFIKGEYGAIEQKEVVYFSLLIRKVIVSL
jgi:hypothetical protein